MTLVLDSGGISALAGNRERLRQVQARGEWPPLVPSVALTEALTGDHRRDFHENRVLRLCDVVPVDEALARAAAVLRTRAASRGASAVDAIVVALADRSGGAVVLSGDPADLRSLAEHTAHPVRVSTT